MKKYLLFLLIMTFVISAPALAEMSGGGYSIPLLAISSGGSASMEGGSYRMQDIKGQGVIGSSSGGGYTVGMGGIYALAGPTIIEGDWPYGTVPLYISRLPGGSILRITWEARFINPEIYVLMGNGQGRYASGEGWTKVTQGGTFVSGLPSGPDWDFSMGAIDLEHNSQVGRGTGEAYYKGLQAGVSPTASNPRVAGKTFLQSAWGVGKVNVILNRGWNSVSSPFVAGTFGSDTGVVGNNFGNGDSANFWGEAIQDMEIVYVFSGGTWGSVANILIPGRGCMFNISSLAEGVTRTITLVGSVSTVEVTREIRAGLNDIGNPFPRALVSGGFSPASADPPSNLVTGDTLNEWGRTDFSNAIIYNAATSSWAGSLTFRPGAGYWYNHVSTAGPFRWTVRRD
jgi:hypothetical protein